MCLETLAAESAGDFLVKGLARDDTWTWTSAAELFLWTSQGEMSETAPSGNAAMQVLAERSVDVILSDMRMPDVDGSGLYLRIKNAYPKLLERMVFMTGDTLGPANRAFLERTGLPYLEKPLSPDEVRQVVQQVLAGAEDESA